MTHVLLVEQQLLQVGLQILFRALQLLMGKERVAAVEVVGDGAPLMLPYFSVKRS